MELIDLGRRLLADGGCATLPGLVVLLLGLALAGWMKVNRDKEKPK